jgi:hypothetical protein
MTHFLRFCSDASIPLVALLSSVCGIAGSLRKRATCQQSSAVELTGCRFCHKAECSLEFGQAFLHRTLFQYTQEDAGGANMAEPR